MTPREDYGTPQGYGGSGQGSLMSGQGTSSVRPLTRVVTRNFGGPLCSYDPPGVPVPGHGW